MINAAYASSLAKIEHELRFSPKSLWNYTQSKKGTSRIPDKMTCKGKKFENPQQILDIFSDHFAKIFNDKTNVTSTSTSLLTILASTRDTLRKICWSH